mmetsp:Transcript_33203/g.85328  ORF Transcript_33203/g.85328 Transcript_33203/m.85328 type:complete len:211 (-) Transcript_33203:560-1192(-)
MPNTRMRSFNDLHPLEMEFPGTGRLYYFRISDFLIKFNLDAETKEAGLQCLKEIEHEIIGYVLCEINRDKLKGLDIPAKLKAYIDDVTEDNKDKLTQALNELQEVLGCTNETKEVWREKKLTPIEMTKMRQTLHNIEKKASALSVSVSGNVTTPNRRQMLLKTKVFQDNTDNSKANRTSNWKTEIRSLVTLYENIKLKFINTNPTPSPHP